MSLFYPQTVLVSTTLAREDVRGGVLWQVFWLPHPSSGLPIPGHQNSGTNMLERFPFQTEKGGVTAAGPLPIPTGFPIKPQRAPQIPVYAKTVVASREKRPACMTRLGVPKKHCRSWRVLIRVNLA
jgi:hypothetical protein